MIAGLTVTVLYTALSLFCWQHLAAAGVTTHMYRLNLGDVGQRVWFMAWLPFAIAHHTNPLVSTYMFAPHGINVLANASVLLEAFLLSPITALSCPFSGTPLAWQAVAGFPYRDYDGYGWHPQQGQRTANAGANPSPLGYIVGTAAGLSPSITLTHVLCREIAATFARNSVRVAVVIGGYPGSAPLTRVYDQVFGPGRRFGDGEIWNAANNRC